MLVSGFNNKQSHFREAGTTPHCSHKEKLEHIEVHCRQWLVPDLMGGADCRGGQGLQGRHGGGGSLDDAPKQCTVVQAGLALPANFCHDLNCLPAHMHAYLLRTESASSNSCMNANATAG